MPFRRAAILGAIVCAILFPILLFGHSSYMATYGVQSTDSAAFMSRRAAPLLLGLAAMLWIARDVGPSTARQAIRACVIFSFAGIAATGIAEYVTGYASWQIMVAAAGELTVAVVFVWFLTD